MRKSLFLSSLPMLAISLLSGQMQAQKALYENNFNLSQVKLLDSPFKQACELNLEVLHNYDLERLMAPFLKEAGITPKAQSFPNWIDLDGHVGGHYLSALAIHYASTGDPICLERMNYMVDQLKECQDKNGNGYVGGIPNSKKLWDELRQGNQGIVWQYWVPWYNLHKTYAGLRDAWLYGGNQKAKTMFLHLCDWGIEVLANLDAAKMEAMLDQEFGGMNEVYADAYKITGESKYLDCAKKFAHHKLFDSMANGIDNLDNMHANTQVPKAVGYERVAEVSHDHQSLQAAEFFWNTVVSNRTLAFGGNSRREHFPSAADCISYMQEREGPESCNTYNMLKLSEGLFRIDPNARYADYYERALYNHILSTQHPDHGGYVYFTPACPGHYRVYSSTNQAMWCCVGTGMENHGKYGEFIYTHQGDSLYVNLFIASSLDWTEKGIKITQNTTFPFSQKTSLTINTNKKKSFPLMLRQPGWMEEGQMKISCNGKEIKFTNKPGSYIAINRKWNDGDILEIELPMSARVETLPNNDNYIAIMRGPVLLASRLGTDNIQPLVAGDDRWGHIAHGKLTPIFNTPVIKGTLEEVKQKVANMKPVGNDGMTFTVPTLFEDDKYKDIVLEPFFKIHDCRYMIYWLMLSPQEYAQMEKDIRLEEEKRLQLDRRTVDIVIGGEQQPEADHMMKVSNSKKGIHQGEAWRDASDGGFIEYMMDTQNHQNLSLMVRYWGNEQGNRKFDILIDDALLKSVDNAAKWNKSEFVDEEYPIPAQMLNGKKSVKVTFRSHNGNTAGGIFRVRLLKEE